MRDSEKYVNCYAMESANRIFQEPRRNRGSCSCKAKDYFIISFECFAHHFPMMLIAC